MSRRECCIAGCQSKSHPYGFTPAGDHGTVCNYWFTPAPAPDWPANLAGQTIIFNSQNFLISQVGGSGAPQPYSLYLNTAPTLPWSLDFTTSGVCTQCGSTFTPDPAPAGWIENAFAGKWVALGSTNYPIVSNTTDSFTLGDSLPKIGFAIAFTYYQSTGFTVSDGEITFNVAPTGWFTDQLVGHAIELLDGNNYLHVAGAITANTPTSMTLDAALPTTEGGDFSISGGVFTPAVPPVGWYGGSTYTNGRQAAFRNRTLELRDPSGAVQYSTTINYFSTTSLYLYAPLPPDGAYTGWTWRIVDPFARWRWRFNPSIATNGSATPCQAAEPNVLTWWTPSYNPYSPGWTGGEFVGCTITFDGVQGVVTANTTDTLTVSRTSPAFGPLPWNLVGSTTAGLLRPAGYVRACGAQITDTVPNNWTNSMAGLPLKVRGDSYTIASVQSATQCTMTADVDMDFSWCLANYPSGQYWDIVSPGFATGLPAAPCGGHVAESSADGAKILWHTPLAIQQYRLSVAPKVNDFDATPGTLRLFFGPDGEFFFETIYGAASGTSRLVCGDQSCQLTQVINPDVTWLCSPPALCIWQAADGYHVLAAPAQYARAGWYYRWCDRVYVPLGLELTIPEQDWQSAPHRIGIGCDNGTSLCALTMTETRGTAAFPPPTGCATCGGCHIPNWPGPDLPELQVTIAGGILAGTYLLQYGPDGAGYFGCYWTVGVPSGPLCSGAPDYITNLLAQIQPNTDGTMTLTISAVNWSHMYPVTIWSVSGVFAEPFTSMALPVPALCEITSIAASLI